MQSLLDLLHDQLHHNLDDAEFSALLDLAEEENILASAADRLLRNSACTPDQTKRLQGIAREIQLSSFVWTETLKSLVVAFDRVRLPVISLKGPCLAERLYGDSALRTSYDLDLLVRKSDFAAAERVLAELGFLPNGYPDDYHRAWSRRGINVELHHNVENPFAFNFNLAAVWTRAHRSSFQSVPVWPLAPEDELLYLCLHGVRHRFDRLCLVLDLVLAFRVLPVASPELHDSGFDNVLALGWMMARCLDPTIPDAISIQPSDRQRIAKLADQLWQERMLQPAETLDWAAQHRFYLQLETPGRGRILRRWRHSMILLTRLIEADFVFASRFNLTRNWQVRLLRPIRLLMKSLHTSSRTV